MSEITGPQILEGHYVPQQNKSESGVKAKILIQLILALFCVGGLVFAGFYFGRQSVVKTVAQASPSVEPSPELPSPSIPTATNAQIFPIPSTIALSQTISLSINSKSYTLKAPEGWKLSQETHNYTSETRISNDQYALIIRTNEATEGAPCGFNDAPIAPSEMFSDVSSFTYDDYVEINGIYRRVDNTANPSTGKSFFAICEKRADQSTWFQPTSFGFITYEVPYDENAVSIYKDILTTMDNMVASLKIK